MEKADIGLIGLAVMGENLILNMESRGFTVAVYNRTLDKVEKFVARRGPRGRRSSAPTPSPSWCSRSRRRAR